MRYHIVGRNLEVTEGLKSYITEKLGKLERYFVSETEVNVTLSVEKDRQKIEVTIPMKGTLLRSEQTSSDMYVSIDLVEEVIERRLKKYKKKMIARNQGAENLRREFIEQAEILEPEDIQIIRTKQVEMKPMFPEDACVQMELLGHSFYMFQNALTDTICVVYKRKGSTYGMIEPEQ